MAGLRAFLDELLIALADAEAQATVPFLDPEEVAKDAGLAYVSGWVTKAVHHFEDQRWLRSNPRVLGSGSPDGGHLVEMTAAGLLEADELRAALVPAADRFVLRSDNQTAFQQASDSVACLTKAVRGANGLFADPDERLGVIRELEGVSRLLDGAKVRAAAVFDVISGKGVVRWLTRAGAAGVVGELATGALRALARLIGVPI